MRPVFRDPRDPVLVDDLVVRSWHGAGGHRKRVVGEDSRLGVHFADVTGLMAGVPNVALPIERSVVEHEQLPRQFEFGDHHPSPLAAGTAKYAERGILRIRTADA